MRIFWSQNMIFQRFQTFSKFHFQLVLKRFYKTPYKYEYLCMVFITCISSRQSDEFVTVSATYPCHRADKHPWIPVMSQASLSLLKYITNRTSSNRHLMYGHQSVQRPII